MISFSSSASDSPKKRTRKRKLADGESAPPSGKQGGRKGKGAATANAAAGADSAAAGGETGAGAETGTKKKRRRTDKSGAVPAPLDISTGSATPAGPAELKAELATPSGVSPSATPSATTPRPGTAGEPSSAAPKKEEKQKPKITEQTPLDPSLIKLLEELKALAAKGVLLNERINLRVLFSHMRGSAALAS